MTSMLISSSKKNQVIDLTDDINLYLKKNNQDGEGICAIFVAHTTAAITVCDLDPGTDLDMIDAFERIMPQLQYRHPHDPSHVGDHIWSSIIGVSKVLLYKSGTLILGTWQRVVLIEFSGPRDRTIYIKTV